MKMNFYKNACGSPVCYHQVLRIVGLVIIWLTSNLHEANAQVGQVLWEDNFNSLNTDIWNPNTGDGCDIGLCGWGNAELEYYSPNNVTIEDIPGEPGNKALVLEARNENAGTRAFTSGKVDTEGNLSVHYGLIEVRMMVPDLETGLWPAAWLLGTANLTWPGKGEIDMMEMGHAQEERTRQGHPGSTVNNYVGANAIFATPEGVGSIAYDVDYNQPYVSSTPMNDRFITYRLYWDPTELRFTVVDQGTEYDLYTGPLPIDPDGVTSAFTRPFYMLLNLAVGGNFTDAATNGQVTAPLPAKMYIDYVRVSEWNGHGTVELDYNTSQPESGVFGVYTDNTPTNNSLVFGSDAEIYGWGGTVQEGTTPPFEGDNVIAWETTAPNSWFGGGITALFGKNMSNYVDNGSLKFKIKIPADVTFRIGITDNYTNESYVTFPAGVTTYGLVRDGEWGSVEIPLADLAGLIAFQDISYLFAIVSQDGALPGTTFQFAVDDIVWDDGNGSTPTLTSIQVSPSSATINEGETQQFTAQAFDQNGNAMNTTFSWGAFGGTISGSGLFTGTTSGDFLITASSTGISDSANITVIPITTAISIPAKIEAEDYKAGGQGIGYNDMTSGNIGGAYRSDDVDIQATTDTGQGYNVGWIDATEWLEFDINATASSNTYDLKARVASPNGNGRLHIEVDGVNVTGTMVVPNTGNWQAYQTVTASNISISPGNHTFRVVFDAAGLNLNYIDVVESTTTPVGWAIPGRIEAENFNSGGEGIGYHDTTPGNTGGAFRPNDNVDIQNTGDVDGLYNVGWIAPGEWLAFDINATSQAGNYDLELRVASPNGNGRLHVEVDGVNVTGEMIVPNTGSWQNYETITATGVNISPGNHVIRVVFDASGLNLNYLEAKESEGNNNPFCSGSALNGDYNYTISGGNSPNITFEPGYAGIGAGIVILYYGKTPTGGYPGYIVSPNDPFTLENVSPGETIYFYYTYSVPEGGERNTSNDRHHFVVGECGETNARVAQETDLNEQNDMYGIYAYPNPANHVVSVELTGSHNYQILQLVDLAGHVYYQLELGSENAFQIAVDELNAGLYLLRFYGEAGQKTLKFFKK